MTDRSRVPPIDEPPESITGDQAPHARHRRGRRRSPSWQEVEGWRRRWRDPQQVGAILRLLARSAPIDEYTRLGVGSLRVETNDGVRELPDLRGFDLTRVPREARTVVSSGITADLSYAQLHGALLTDLDLSGALLYRAQLPKTTLRRVNLSRTDLTKANVEDADLRGARVDDANLGFIRYTEDRWLDHGTILRVLSLPRAVNVDPVLERYARDQDYLYNYKDRIRHSPVRRLMFYLWWLTSDYGNNLLLWGCWSLLLVLGFALVYFPAPDWTGSWWQGFSERHGPRIFIDEGMDQTSVTYLYFSVSTFMTLGMGDVRPLNWQAQLLVLTEVMTGYVMFGILLSILANKIARRA